MSIFDSLRIRRLPRSKFDLSHTYKTNVRMGDIVPFFWEETTPGDYFSVNPEMLIRTLPLASPLMDQIDVSVYFFDVPLRLIFDDYEEFFAGDRQSTYEPDLRVPSLYLRTLHMNMLHQYEVWEQNFGTEEARVRFSRYFTHGIANYLGLPIPSINDIVSVPEDETVRNLITALPFFAYHQLVNDYFIDANLEEPFDYKEEFAKSNGFGGNWNKLYCEPRRRYYHKDYFTGALPNPQRGQDVNLPFAASAPVDFNTNYNGAGFAGNLVYEDFGGTAATADLNFPSVNPTVPSIDATLRKNNSTPAAIYFDNDGQKQPLYGIHGTSNGTSTNNAFQAASGGTDAHFNLRAKQNGELHAYGLEADLTEASSITIADLRRAESLQQFLEMSMRVGHRYVEYVRGFFGTRTKDARLDRAIFLGGGKMPISIGEVVQTGAAGSADKESFIGSQYGRGVGYGSRLGFKKHYVDEHSIIMGVMTVMPKDTIYGGVARSWYHTNKFDYFIPQFQHIGEQEIMNTEVNAWSAHPTGTFGYVPRYAEYKYHKSLVTGDLAPAENLGYWTLARNMMADQEDPQLSPEFLQVPANELQGNVFTFNDESTYPFIINMRIDEKANRQMSYYGEPRFY